MEQKFLLYLQKDLIFLSIHKDYGFNQSYIMQNKKEAHYIGHRQRLKNKFIERGADSLADYEILELYLFRTLPRRDIKPLAKILIEEYGNLSAIISTPYEKLIKTKGIGERTALDLKILQATSLRSSQSALLKKPILASWSALLNYCKSAMQHEAREQFRCLFLDKKNCLIKDEIMSIGTVDHTAVYPREIARKALEYHATAFIMVHNHPSGDVTPSRPDIIMTKKIVEASKALNIIVHDHLIIGKESVASFKTLGLL